jgi:hypothetical protein
MSTCTVAEPADPAGAEAPDLTARHADKKDAWLPTTHERSAPATTGRCASPTCPGGGLQTSPVLVGVDGDGKLVISTREGAYKTRNLRRDPTGVLCVFADSVLGRWLQVEGSTQIVSLPAAMQG